MTLDECVDLLSDLIEEGKSIADAVTQVDQQLTDRIVITEVLAHFQEVYKCNPIEYRDNILDDREWTEANG